jgi:hypothetical protein
MEIRLALLALVGGLVGGAISNQLFEGMPVLAQARPSYPKVLKAERLELVSKQGKAVAVFDIRYGAAFPGHSGFPDGSPVLTLNDEFDGQAREISISTARILMSYGKESSVLRPSVGFMLNSPKGLVHLGFSALLGPDGPPALILSSTLPAKSGMSTLTNHSLAVSDKDGDLRAALELASFGAVGPEQPAIRLFAKKGSAHAIFTLLPDETGSMFLADRNGSPSWHATAI